MPQQNRTIRATSAILATAALAAGLPATASAADCPLEKTAQAFTWLGDPNWYYLAPGGDFEGTVSWTQNTKVKVKKRTFLTSFIGAQMLSLDPGGMTTSPVDCVDATRTHLRTGIRAVGGTGSLRAEALVDGRSVLLGTLNGARYANYGVSEFVPLGTALHLAAGVRSPCSCA